MGRVARAFVGVLFVGGAAGLAGQVGRQVRLAGFRDLEAELELRYESEERDRKSKVSDSRTGSEDSRLHELLDVGWRGFIYHPRFLDFTVSLGVDLEQGHVSTETAGDKRRERVSEESPRYGISGTFLSEHPVSLNFDLQKRRSTIQPGFADIADVDTGIQRVAVNIREVRLPTRLFYSHVSTVLDQRGVGESRDDEETSYGFVIDHDEGRSRSQLGYERRDEVEEVTNVTGVSGVEGPTALETSFITRRKVHDALFTNRLALDDTGRSALRSRVHFRDETGTFPQDRFLVDESLHLAHSDTLTSDYGLGYFRDTVGESETDRVQARAALQHRLYQSLATNVEVHASQEDYDISSRDIYGGSVALDYRKHIPFGMLSVGLGFGRELTDEQGGAGVRQALDERHVLSGSSTALLKNIDVNEGSIVVTNAAGTTTYVRDIDYRVVQRGGRVELRRIPAGQIPSGSTVLVDYSYVIETPLEYTTRQFYGRVRVDLFDHVSLYVRRDSTTHDVGSGVQERAERLEDLYSTIYGAEARWGPATLTAEHEGHDSSITPFETDRVLFRVAHTLDRIHTVSAAATWQHTKFEEEDDAAPRDEEEEAATTATTTTFRVLEDVDETTVRTLSLSYRVAPPRWPSFSVELGYEKSKDRGESEDYAYTRIELDYTIRDTEVSASLWLRKRDDDFAEETTDYFLFSIKRRF